MVSPFAYEDYSVVFTQSLYTSYPLLLGFTQNFFGLLVHFERVSRLICEDPEVERLESPVDALLSCARF